MDCASNKSSKKPRPNKVIELSKLILTNIITGTNINKIRTIVRFVQRKKKIQLNNIYNNNFPITVQNAKEQKKFDEETWLHLMCIFRYLGNMCFIKL